MQEIYVENINEFLRTKNKIEKKIKVRITNKGKNIFIEGPAENEFTALEILKALNLGFSTEQALKLDNEEIILQSVNIKDITKRNDLERIRARIIGSEGRSLKTITNLTQCNLAISGNHVGIIGDSEDIEYAIQAITSIIQGSKHGNIYRRLERLKKNKKIENFKINKFI